ncbi:N-acylglucosamine 2-epimerase-like [Tachypleus tridentatus]|uniref:N-acylglucosamine 2-epimerase-like n=1 Tax=Tachypleus tridentatus TaxID=6853 RepID=UPI003FD2D097
MALRVWMENHLQKVSDELDRVMNFWLKYSHDELYGGFFSCIGKNGQLYDTLKFGWLQGRQVWMYSRLYNELDRYRNSKILNAAIRGAEFMMANLKDKNSKKCYFSVTRNGRPVKIQRTIFTECFYALGLLELGRATKDEKYLVEGLAMIDQIIDWVKTENAFPGLPKLSGSSSVNVMNVPMMLLSLVDEIETVMEKLEDKYAQIREWCIKQILQHVQRNGTVILEKVSSEGKELPGFDGRMFCPGHAIEAGWFLLNEALKMGDNELKKTAIKHFIKGSYNRGWDEKNGGLFYFLDVDGFSPVQLEWSLKLWWPHTEAIIAFLMAFQSTGKQYFATFFDKLFSYTLKEFSDPEMGEWYGYLTRENHLNQDFKAGPYKGCFHVPRALMMCEIMLKQMLDKNN